MMKIKNIVKTKFFKDLSKLTSAKLVSVGVVFILKIIIARLLTKEDFGVIAVLTSLSTYFGMISDFATNSITQRNVIQDRSNYNGHYSIYFFTKIITLSFSTLIFILVSYLLGYFEHDVVMTIIIINMILGTISSIPKVMLESFELFHNYSKIIIIVALFNLIFQTITVYVFRSIEALVFSTLMAACLNILLYWREAKKSLVMSPNLGMVSFADVRKLLVEALPLFLGNFFYLLYYRIDTVMIENILGFEAAAEYSLGFNMADQIIDLIWVQFIIIYYPKMVLGFKKDKDKLFKEMMTISTVITGLFVLGFVISHLLARDAFSIVFGLEYANSGVIFKWAMASSLFITLFFIL
ncbi:oligosaccharide flippase family protein [Vibrio panuliri]|uniref:oligosaccharide flippase family protein n=1 Tax=Vibrio panuliri TaxID=1381081 RepID=UPI001386E98E|nr:oligosaccharide flippase family protein [Vibrio panuliri]